MNVNIKHLQSSAAQLRGRIIELSHTAETPHLGSSLSCVDMLVAVYGTALRIDPKDPLDPKRDRFILSKGHAASALYTTLAWRHFFPWAELNHFNEDGGHLPEQPTLQCVPGVEAATGSLGHGLPLALGMAAAHRIHKYDARSFVLMSDGECEEGTTWEAALLASANKLDRICVLIDYNKWQATGRSDEVGGLAPLRDKWQAFGWDAHEIDGHDMATIVDLVKTVPNGTGKPIAIIANTIKGKGVSFMQDDNNWHYRIPTADEVVAAKKELSEEWGIK